MSLSAVKGVLRIALLLVPSLPIASACSGPAPMEAPPTTQPRMAAPAPPSSPPVAAPNPAPLTLTLAPGFLAPVVVATTAGGAASAGRFRSLADDDGCRGAIGSLPNLILTTTAPMSLHVLARAAADPEHIGNARDPVPDRDTSLVVVPASGPPRCDDDDGGYPNPSIFFEELPAGVHEIYVGAVHEGERYPAAIGLVVDRTTRAAALPDP